MTLFADVNNQGSDDALSIQETNFWLSSVVLCYMIHIHSCVSLCFVFAECPAGTRTKEAAVGRAGSHG
jgi:hypothetical protein